MIRERLLAALKDANDAGDERAAATLRLVLAALKERDLAARGAGDKNGIEEREIIDILRHMIQQRRREIARCEEQARIELADQEAEEIGILNRFLPPQMTKEQIDAAVDAVIDEIGATRLKDTGRVIAELKERYGGEMDFTRAKRSTCERLG